MKYRNAGAVTSEDSLLAGASSSCEPLRRLRKRQRTIPRAISATPDTTPPTIAPTLTLEVPPEFEGETSGDDELLAVGLEFALVLSIIFIVPVVLVGLDTLIILDVMILMDATVILDMPVLFAAFVAPVGLFEFGLALGATLVIPATVIGFKFEVGMAGILLEVGITMS